MKHSDKYMKKFKERVLKLSIFLSEVSLVQEEKGILPLAFLPLGLTVDGAVHELICFPFAF